MFQRSASSTGWVHIFRMLFIHSPPILRGGWWKWRRMPTVPVLPMMVCMSPPVAAPVHAQAPAVHLKQVFDHFPARSHAPHARPERAFAQLASADVATAVQD